MPLRALAFAFLFALGLDAAHAGSTVLRPETPQTFRFAFQGDLNALDPYTLNETFTLGTLGNVMEGLIKRDKDLKIVPGLAERWEVLAPTRWRFHLRRSMTFHDGSPFTADDVIFSADRVRGPGSQLKYRIPADAKVEKVDDHTVDFVLTRPNPILHYEWETWYILSRSWSEANGAAQAQPATAKSLSPFALKANGTGPFVVASHEPGVKTVFRPNTGWWGKVEHNLGEVVFRTIGADATRVAALLAGDMDLIDPVPVQDIARVRQTPNTAVLTGAELRTIYLNLDSLRDELLNSSVKGRNPFKDARVRRAVYQAIDIEAIRAKVMRGMATPTSLMISPLLFARAGEIARLPYDRAAAKRQLAEAGYPDGFALQMDCPNDRYVNDEEICQAIAAMLARVDIRITLNILPKAQYFEKVGPTRKYDSSFNLVGWTPGSFDSYNVLANVVACRDANGKGAAFNFGGYCNPRIDELTRKILVEIDTAERDDMIAQAYRILRDDAGIIPLHQQALAWGIARNVQVVQRADNLLRFEWVRKN